MTASLVNVFVSSTWLDLQPERAAVESALQRLRETKFVGMKYFGSRDEDTRRTSLDEVDRCQVYVGIFGGRYGSGITEAEYRHAQELGLYCLIYFKDKDQIASEWQEQDTVKATRLAELKAELRQRHTIAAFTSPDDLAAKVTADLHRWLFDEYLAPRLEKAVQGDFPHEEAQALLAAVRDLSALNQDLLAQLRESGYAIASGGSSIAISGSVIDSTVITAGRDVIIYDKGTKPVSVGALLDACQAQVKSVLYDVRHKYDPDLYVNRAIEHDLNAFFDTSLEDPARNCFLIVAPAGSGKTNLLCELARVRVTQQPVLLLMGSNLYIGATTGLLGAIEAELEAASSEVAFRSAGDSLHTLHRLAEEMDRDALLILDAINEHDQPAQMRKAIEDLLRKTRGKRIKLVVTCRDYYWGLFKGQIWEGATVNDPRAEADEDEIDDTEADFSRFAVDEHERAFPLYLEHYQISGRPVGDAAEKCRHPLLLRFFCEAYRGQYVGEVKSIRLKELFDRYWGEKLASIAERMIHQGAKGLQHELAAEAGDSLLTLAAHMLHENVRAIQLAQMPQVTGSEEQRDDQFSLYGRIRDEYIILEEKEQGKGRHKVLQVAFVYEEFMEYVMARSLLRDWHKANLDEAAILTGIEELTGKYESFAQILGVMVYLALMLKEERDLALWSLLLSKGTRWEKVVFEAFRKLPEEQLDVGVFNALEEMLAILDEGIQKQVLDTLKVRRVGRAAPVPVVEMLCKLATHKQEPIARRAVLALGNATTDLPTPVLIRTLDDPRKSVRENAITALARQGEPAVEPLLAALTDSSESVRRGVAEALGKLGEQGIEPLIAALKDSNESVRRGAAEALGRVGDARAMEPLIAALEDDYPKVRSAVSEALGKLGDAQAVEPLIATLKDNDVKVQRTVSEALGKLGDARAVEPLIAALRDGVWGVRSRAAEALGKIGNRRAVEPVIAALKDSDFSMWTAAEALGALGDARAVESLIVGLKDPWIRREAAEALRRIGTPEALAAVPSTRHRKRSERKTKCPTTS